MIQEDLITYETAVLAKSKGFDIPCFGYYYGENPKLYYCNRKKDKPYDNSIFMVNELDMYEYHYSAPTQSLLQTWLRYIHNIEVYIIPLFKEKCGYDHFKRDGFGFEIIQSTPCQYLDFSYFLQCSEERNDILNNDDYDEEFKFRFKNFNSYEEALEVGLQHALKLI